MTTTAIEQQHANNNNDISNLSFEKAMAHLDAILQRLESGEVELSKSIAIYERGELLKKHCEGLLKSAELKIEKIRMNAEKKVADIEPLEGYTNSYVDSRDEDSPF